MPNRMLRENLHDTFQFGLTFSQKKISKKSFFSPLKCLFDESLKFDTTKN